jgi:hypothetical protein
MTTSRSAVFLVTLASLWTCFGDADAQKVDMSSTSIEQHVLSLNFTNNGQHLAATVGQRIASLILKPRLPGFESSLRSYPINLSALKNN